MQGVGRDSVEPFQGLKFSVSSLKHATGLESWSSPTAREDTRPTKASPFAALALSVVKNLFPRSVVNLHEPFTTENTESTEHFHNKESNGSNARRR